MKKNFKILLGILIILILVFSIYWFENDKKKNIFHNNEYFQIIDNQNDLIMNKSVEELNLSSQAIAEWQNRIEKLKKDLQKPIEDIKKRDYYNDIALYLNYLGKYQESYEYYLKSLDVSYVNRITWMQLGDLLIKMHAYKSAEIAYQKGNKINPYVQNNYLKLAKLYVLENKKVQDIISFYDNSINFIKESGNAYDLLIKAKAELYCNKKMYKDCINSYEEYLPFTTNKEYIKNKISKIKLKLK